MTYTSPTLKVLTNKGYEELPLSSWINIEKFFDLLWANFTYSITIDYCYLEGSLKILNVKGYRGRDGLSLETMFLSHNHWNSIIPIWTFVNGFLLDNKVLQQKEAGRILVKLSKKDSINCTLIA